jgi:hypothetical protein
VNQEVHARPALSENRFFREVRNRLVAVPEGEMDPQADDGGGLGFGRAAAVTTGITLGVGAGVAVEAGLLVSVAVGGLVALTVAGAAIGLMLLVRWIAGWFITRRLDRAWIEKHAGSMIDRCIERLEIDGLTTKLNEWVDQVLCPVRDALDARLAAGLVQQDLLPGIHQARAGQFRELAHVATRISSIRFDARFRLVTRVNDAGEDEVIGQGAFGRVVAADMIDVRTGNARVVAVKEALGDTRVRPLEVLAMRVAAEAGIRLDADDANRAAVERRGRIVAIYGVSCGGDPIDGSMRIVMERLAGSVRSEVFALANAGQWTVATALALCTQVGRITRILGRGNVLHRDLAPDNLLLTTNGEVVLADFGLSVFESVGDSTLRVYGRVGRIAPELYTAAHQSTPVDVYLAGVVFWELFPKPMGFIDGMAYFAQRAASNIGAAAPPGFAELVAQCCLDDPLMRPSGDDIHTRLLAIAGAIDAGADAGADADADADAVAVAVGAVAVADGASAPRPREDCLICLAEPIAVELQPCGHRAGCAGCTAALRRCPICRALITGREVGYFHEHFRGVDYVLSGDVVVAPIAE